MNPGPSAYRADALPTELRCQLVEPEFNPYKLTHLQITPPLSFFRVNFRNDIFLFFLQYFSVDVTRQDLNPGPSAYRDDALPTALRCQLVEPEFSPYKLTYLQITPLLSYFRVDFLNDIFLFC